MRKMRIVVIAFLLMLLLCVTASAAHFSDVPDDFWASTEIAWAFDSGLMNGTTTTTFNPTGKTLRGQMTAILYRYAGSPSVEQTIVYSDVPSSKYYSDAAIWAVQNCIMEETRRASETMNAGDQISREEFCVMLRNFAVETGKYIPPKVGTEFTDISDLTPANEYAIIWANQNGIVNGTSTTTFNPKGTLTRAAAAAMLYRYENFLNTNPYLQAKAKAEELVNYYACPTPRLIEEVLVTTFGFSADIAETAVRYASISEETWMTSAIALAESFFYSAPQKPSKEDVKQHLVGSRGFSFEIAENAIEEADIAWDTERTDAVYDWVSLTELEDMGFSAFAGWGQIKLTYVTNQEYIMTGLPSALTQGDSFFLDFNDEKVSCMFYSDKTSSPNSWFYLDKYSLISANILSANGVSSSIINGVPQDMLTMSGTTGTESTPAGSSGSSGTSGSVIPSTSTTDSGVWITQNGSKYHSYSGCSGMVAPIQVEVEEAIVWGYTACAKCH